MLDKKTDTDRKSGRDKPRGIEKKETGMQEIIQILGKETGRQEETQAGRKRNRQARRETGWHEEIQAGRDEERQIDKTGTRRKLQRPTGREPDRQEKYASRKKDRDVGRKGDKKTAKRPDVRKTYKLEE
jgi:hypothetical protein